MNRSVNSQITPTIVDVLEQHLAADRSRAGFTFLADGEADERDLSLAELRAAALGLAGRLGPAEPTLILLPPGLRFIKAFFGCLYARAIAVPLALPGKHRGFARLHAVAADARPRTAVTDRATLANLQRWFGVELDALGLRWVLIEEAEAAGAMPVSGAPPRPDEIAFLQYTSGSTARPKAVMVSHANLVANSRLIRECFRNDADSTSVCWLPPFHDMGLVDGLVQPVFTGFRAVLMTPGHFLQKPARWLRALSRYGATYSGGPNFAFDWCRERIRDEELARLDLRGLKCLYNGAEPIRAATLDAFAARFAPVGVTRDKLFTCYGLAESTLAVTTSALGRAPARLTVAAEALREGRVEPAAGPESRTLVGAGRARGDTRLIVVDPETLGVCGEREIGEIWVGGASLSAGYLNAPPENENFVERGGRRYFRTGDLGFLAGGELFVTGRRKELLIIRGQNHYPQDLEETVAASHAALAPHAGAAFAVEIEGEERLVVAQEIRRARLHDADPAAIFSAIMAGLSRAHGLVPHDVVLLRPAGLPKTTSGKIQRQAARRLWSERRFDALASWRGEAAPMQNHL